MDRRVENIGFSPTQRTRYIKQYFALTDHSETAVQTLLEWLTHNPHLLSLSTIPVNCQLLCATWQQYTREGLFFPQQLSLTQLYDHLLTQWQQRALRRSLEVQNKLTKLNHYSKEDLAAQCVLSMELLGKLCLEALCQNAGVIISGDRLETMLKEVLIQAGKPITIETKQQLLEDVLGLGILKPQNLSSHPYKDKYETIHLTFMEYLAAYYLAQQFASLESEEQEKAKTILATYQYQPRFALVWRFLAGRLTTYSKENLNCFLSSLLKGSQDLYGLEQTLLWLSCIGEAFKLLEAEDPTHPLLVSSVNLLTKWLSQPKLSVKESELLFRLLAQCPQLCSQSKIQEILATQIWETDGGADYFTSYDKYVKEDSFCYHLIPPLFDEVHRTLCFNTAMSRLESEEWEMAKKILLMLAPYLNEVQRMTLVLTLFFYQREDLFGGERMILQAMFPYLNETQRMDCFTAVSSKLTDNDEDIRIRAHDFLESLFPHLTKLQQATSWESTMTLLIHQPKINLAVSRLMQSFTLHLHETQCTDYWKRALLKLTDEDYDNQLIAWRVMQILIPQLKQEEHRDCLIIIWLSCMDTDKKYYPAEALELLEILIPYLNDAQHIFCLSAIWRHLADDEIACHHALRALKVLVPYLSETQVLACFEVIILTLKRTEFVIWPALDALTVMIESLQSSAQHTTCLKAVMPWLASQNSYICNAALRTLEALVQYLNKEERTICFKKVLPLLRDQKVHQAVCPVLQGLLPYLDRAEYAACFETLLLSFMELDSQRYYSIEFFKALIPYLNEIERTTCLEKLVFLLDSGDVDVCDSVKAVLSSLFPQLKAIQYTPCLETLLSVRAKENGFALSSEAIRDVSVSLLPFLTTTQYSIYLNFLSHEQQPHVVLGQAYEVLEKIMPYLDEEQRSHFQKAQWSRLTNKNPLIRAMALKILLAYLPYFDETQHREYLEALILNLENAEVISILGDFILNLKNNMEFTVCVTALLAQLINVNEEDSWCIRPVFETLQLLLPKLVEQDRILLVRELLTLECSEETNEYLRDYTMKFLLKNFLLTKQLDQDSVSNVHGLPFTLTVNASELKQINEIYAAFQPEHHVDLIDELQNIFLIDDANESKSETEDSSSDSAEESLSNRSENGQNSLILDEEGKLCIFLNIPYSDIKCPFNRESYLDSGGYGQVHVGFYREEKVAFKTITKPEFLEQFKREVSFMSHFRSTFLLPIFGACFEAPHPCFLMPYAENGSLHQHVGNFQFTQEMRFNVTMDITMGLYQLHHYTSDKVSDGVVHADLKPKNVLLRRHFHAQLADFGCSKMTQVRSRKTEDKEDVGPETGGTFLWMAPEVLEEKPTTKKSDIYGYALILWAIWARETQPNKGMNLSEFANFIVSGGRPALTAEVPALLAKLIKKCWRQEPSQRPTIDFAVKFLREKKDKIFTFFQSVPNSISLEAEVLTEAEPEKEKEQPLHL
jgi:hypothetical protein